jgi:O-antigen ligase
VPLAAPLTLFVLGAIAGLAASYDLRLSMQWVLWLVAGSALYLIVVLFAVTPARLQLVAAIPVIAASLFGLLLVTQYRHLGFAPKFESVAGLGQITSAAFPELWRRPIDANAAAAFLEGSLPLAVALALVARRRMRLLAALAAALTGLGVLLTASRGSWVALTLVGLLALLLRARGAGRRYHKGRLLVPAALLLAGMGLLSLSPSGQAALASAALRAADRLALYRNSLFLALDFPFTGIGPGGTFGMVYSQFQLLIGVPFLGYAHNLPLAIWLAQGLLGLLGFFGLLLGSARLIWRGLGQAGHSAPGTLLSGAALGCLASLLHGLTDSPQYDTSWPTLFMIFSLLGIAVAAARCIDSRPLVWVRPNRRRALLLATIGCLVVVLSGPRIAAAAAANVAAIFEARAALARRLDDTERAALRARALHWAEQGLALHAASLPALKRQASLRMTQRDFAGAALSLEQALARSPADQSIRKALGYAYVWSGRVDQGVAQLAQLDRRDEIVAELNIWPQAWRERGRPDLAEQAQQAARALR